jgi:hypothetical protein
MRVALIALIVGGACSKGPPPKAPPREVPADRVADIAGTWVASDDMDWGYRMTIEVPGVIDVWIDRGKLGRCEQKGTIAASAPGRAFRITYTRGECNPQAVGIPIEMTVSSFTGEALTIMVGDQRRTYARSP